MGDSEAFAPQPVASAHEHRVLAINMTHGNLEALAGEYEAAGGVVAKIDRRLRSIEAPAIVIQGSEDHLVASLYALRLAARLPHARLQMLSGGHMQPYDHPSVIAEAVRSLQAAGSSSR
jgi:pimeloyl-ACP methyl ester carboxylesterase